MSLRPMLAAPLDSLDQVQFPCYATPKIDGFRVYKYQGEVYVGRNGELLQNRYAYNFLKSLPIDNVDGEMTIPGMPFHLAGGRLRASDGEPQFLWQLFDSLHDLRVSHSTRVLSLLSQHDWPRVEILTPTLLYNIEQLERYIASCLNRNYEGVCLRSLDGLVKQGRSTVKQFWLVKWKPFADDEATIVGFNEELENLNDREVNPFGLTKRSHHAENKVPKGRLGSFTVLWNGVTFDVGSGLTDAQRLEYWNRRSALNGRTITFKYQKHGTVDRPRSPVFKCIREIS